MDYLSIPHSPYAEEDYHSIISTLHRQFEGNQDVKDRNWTSILNTASKSMLKSSTLEENSLVKVLRHTSRWRGFL